MVPWQTIAWNIEDIDTPGFPLFSDETARIGESYYYRIKARNNAGISAPSNVVGPVNINWLTRVDKARNIAVLEESRGVKVATGDYRSYKEAFSRLEGDKDAWISYVSPGTLKELRLYVYESGEKSALDFSANADTGDPVENLKMEVTNYRSSEKNYDYLVPKLYKVSDSRVQSIKADFLHNASIVRVEIDYQ